MVHVDRAMKAQLTVISAISCMLFAALPADAQWWSSSGSSSSNSRSSSSSRSSSTTPSGIIGSPIGTTTSASPRFYGSPGLSPAPGVMSTTGAGLTPGQFMYYNNAGVGYYTPNPTATQFPAYALPIPLGGGYYQLGGLTERLGYWRAPSGYYYPWCPPIYMPGVAYSPAAAIYQIQQGLLTPTQPSVGAMISDMRTFIENAKEKGQLDESNYENFFRRVNDLSARASDLSAKNGGMLNITDDRSMRKEIDHLSADIARSLNP
jgi:hypothetical protein